MLKAQFIFLFFILSFTVGTTAQKNIYYSNNTGMQLGYSVKAIGDIGHRNGSWFHWRVGISGGIGAFMGNDWCYPTLHTDFMFYHGGIGSRWPGLKKGNYLDAEITIGYSVTAGYQNRMRYDINSSPVRRSYPLYYFNTFQAPPLQNPYVWSATLGGNVIIFLTREKDKVQQVGFANLHFNRVQLSYINDGPFFKPPLADMYDRMHTGGGYITYHGNREWDLDLVEFGFNKFTGYSKNSYELANRLGTGYMYYKDTTQHFYNKGRIYLNAVSTRKSFGMSLNLNNVNSLDIQHRIHLGAFYPLHMVPYKWHISAAPTYYFNQTYIGLK